MISLCLRDELTARLLLEALARPRLAAERAEIPASGAKLVVTDRGLGVIPGNAPIIRLVAEGEEPEKVARTRVLRLPLRIGGFLDLVRTSLTAPPPDWPDSVKIGPYTLKTKENILAKAR